MQLREVWQSAVYIRNEEDEIIAVQIPIEQWRVLMDRVQQMEDRDAARDRLARLRKTQQTDDSQPEG
ncbi:MAG: hypothetical protein GXY36_19920 [Chloroflexi bacterium]|jgi:hypothetical protein|nr:hypothetical protein [Chloroflexota bacterium]